MFFFFFFFFFFFSFEQHGTMHYNNYLTYIERGLLTKTLWTNKFKGAFRIAVVLHSPVWIHGTV